MTKVFLFFPFILLYVLEVTAQEPNRTYRTLDYVEALTTTKDFKKSKAKIERAHKDLLRFSSFKDHTIPVVFHVLYTSEAERIPEELLYQQLEILNQDFANESQETYEIDARIGDQRNLGRYNKYRDDARIEFCFASNKKKYSINYVSSTILEWTDFYSMKQREHGAIPWNTKQYLNVWVCNLPDDNSGFAQMPGGPEEFDGIVIDYRFIRDIGDKKSNYNSGHTLTHLVGNYLGLYPLWGPSPCSDDFVDDTPVHNGPNFRCESIDHLSSCSGYPTEMINNFMDNTDDECLSIFTRGQIARMQAMLDNKGPRGQLNIPSTQCDEIPEKLASNKYVAIPSESTLPVHDPYKLTVHPNPTNDRFYINLQPTTNLLPDRFEVEVYSLSGALMFRNESLTDQITLEIDVSQWPSGVYLLKLGNRSHNYEKRIVVE